MHTHIQIEKKKTKKQTIARSIQKMQAFPGQALPKQDV